MPVKRGPPRRLGEPHRHYLNRLIAQVHIYHCAEISTTLIMKFEIEASADTVRRTLHELGKENTLCRRVSLLTDEHKANHVEL